MYKSLLLLLFALTIWNGPGQTARKPAATEKFKAIWEPVNYKQDAELRDVAFVSADTGWVAGSVRSDAGEGGVILHTADGGQNWDVQMGDPHSGTRGFEQVFFLNAKHGWATQGGDHLLRTTDGETWEDIGEFSATAVFTFVTPEVGFFIHSKDISRTADSGRSWKHVYHCRDKVEVNGLVQDAECEFHGVACPTAKVCYASTQALRNKAAAIAKSEDGGVTWNITGHVPEASAGDYGLIFSDVQSGFMRGFAQVWSTADGGQNWRKAAGTFPGGSVRLHLADHEVGWLAGDTTIAYTSDGGKRWNTMEVKLPARINASSVPARDRGYVVGDHGMVYRYRVVPIDYNAKGIIAAAMIAPVTAPK